MRLQLTTAQPARYAQPTTRALKLAYVIFERSDLNQAEKFLTDFGLRVAKHTADALYLRDSSASPFCYIVRKASTSRFVGFGLQVDSVKDLQRLANLPGASNVEAAPYPQGGSLVKLVDPAGHVVEAIVVEATIVEANADQQPVTPILQCETVNSNRPSVVNRINATRRIQLQPPPITKLGHVVIEIPNFQETCAWYTRHFGFIPSDVQIIADGSPTVAFMRLDLGDTPTDHHTLGLVQGVTNGFNHCSFEVADVDAVAMGQRVLQQRRYDHAWGMGRHIFGSQIFDYWRDPWQDKHEHYCDGDQFTADVAMGVHALSAESMAQWGPPMPRSFTRPKFDLKLLKSIAHNLRHTPDLTWYKLKTLAKMFS